MKDAYPEVDVLSDSVAFKAGKTLSLEEEEEPSLDEGSEVVLEAETLCKEVVQMLVAVESIAVYSLEELAHQFFPELT